MARIPVRLPQTPIGSSNPASPRGINTGPSALTTRGPAQRREQFPIRALNSTQAAARAATVQATSQDDAGANTIPGVSFTGGVTQLLPHGLTDSKGRPIAWTSYRIENVQGNFARFIAAHVSAAQDVALIAVTADANCVADVRVW